MSGEPKTLTPQRFQHRHPVEAIQFNGKNAFEVYRFLGWEKAGDIVRRNNEEGVIRLGITPDLRTGDWLVRRPQPLHAHSGYPRPGRYVAYSDEDFHATYEPLGVPVVARDEAAELRAAVREWAEAEREYIAERDNSRRTRTTFERLDATQDRWLAALENLRRLAGGENKK